MLVCNVSQSQRRTSIAVDVAEVAAALDAPGTGNVVFATLVDDPASVGDHVDAFLGQIMLEAANAAATVNAGFAYAVAIAETATAADVPSASVSATVLATLNGVANQVTLSNGNLTATYNGGGGSTSGARSATVKSTGKYYLETTVGLMRNGDAIAILLSTGTYFNLINDGTNCTVAYGTGAIWSNNANTGKTIGSYAAAPGSVVGVAVDIGARLAWFRRGAGNWNGDPTANPATGVGGVTIAASGSFGAALGFNGAPGDNATVNFGQSTYANAAPAGFGNWMT